MSVTEHRYRPGRISFFVKNKTERREEKREEKEKRRGRDVLRTRLFIYIYIYVTFFLFEIATQLRYVARIQNFCNSGRPTHLRTGSIRRPLERSMRSTNCDPTRCTHVRTVSR